MDKENLVEKCRRVSVVLTPLKNSEINKWRNQRKVNKKARRRSWKRGICDKRPKKPKLSVTSAKSSSDKKPTEADNVLTEEPKPSDTNDAKLPIENNETLPLWKYKRKREGSTCSNSSIGEPSVKRLTIDPERDLSNNELHINLQRLRNQSPEIQTPLNSIPDSEIDFQSNEETASLIMDSCEESCDTYAGNRVVTPELRLASRVSNFSESHQSNSSHATHQSRSSHATHQSNSSHATRHSNSSHATRQSNSSHETHQSNFSRESRVSKLSRESQISNFSDELSQGSNFSEELDDLDETQSIASSEFNSESIEMSDTLSDEDNESDDHEDQLTDLCLMTEATVLVTKLEDVIDLLERRCSFPDLKHLTEEHLNIIRSLQLGDDYQETPFVLVISPEKSEANGILDSDSDEELATKRFSVNRKRNRRRILSDESSESEVDPLDITKDPQVPGDLESLMDQSEVTEDDPREEPIQSKDSDAGSSLCGTSVEKPDESPNSELLSCSGCRATFKSTKAQTRHVCYKKKKPKDQKSPKSPSKSSKSKKQAKLTPKSTSLDCTVCLQKFDSHETLSEHIFKHTPRELQEAYKKAAAKRNATNEETPDLDLESDPEGISEVPVMVNARRSGIAMMSDKSTKRVSIPVNICPCHAHDIEPVDHTVQIEMVLYCENCKVLFRRSDCLEMHYRSNAECNKNRGKGRSPRLFCSTCRVVLNTLGDMRKHLERHVSINRHGTVTFVCNICRVVFFGVGTVFCTHWFNHDKDPMFVASRYSFPKLCVSQRGKNPIGKQPGEQYFFVAEYVCRICKQQFSSDSDLSHHAKEVCKGEQKQSDSLPSASGSALVGPGSVAKPVRFSPAVVSRARSTGKSTAASIAGPASTAVPASIEVPATIEVPTSIAGPATIAGPGTIEVPASVDVPAPTAVAPSSPNKTPQQLRINVLTTSQSMAKDGLVQPGRQAAHFARLSSPRVAVGPRVTLNPRPAAGPRPRPTVQPRPTPQPVPIVQSSPSTQPSPSMQPSPTVQSSPTLSRPAIPSSLSVQASPSAIRPQIDDKSSSYVKTWICEICDATFSSRKALVENHAVVHFDAAVALEKFNSSVQRPYACTICREAYSSLESLTKHWLKHELMKYACSACNDTYYTIQAFIRHVIVLCRKRDPVCRVSFGTKETCGICKLAFKTGEDLTKHNIDYHAANRIIGVRPAQSPKVPISSTPTINQNTSPTSAKNPASPNVHRQILTKTPVSTPAVPSTTLRKLQSTELVLCVQAPGNNEVLCVQAPGTNEVPAVTANETNGLVINIAIPNAQTPTTSTETQNSSSPPKIRALEDPAVQVVLTQANSSDSTLSASLVIPSIKTMESTRGKNSSTFALTVRDTTAMGGSVTEKDSVVQDDVITNSMIAPLLQRPDETVVAENNERVCEPEPEPEPQIHVRTSNLAIDDLPENNTTNNSDDIEIIEILKNPPEPVIEATSEKPCTFEKTPVEGRDSDIEILSEASAQEDTDKPPEKTTEAKKDDNADDSSESSSEVTLVKNPLSKPQGFLRVKNLSELQDGNKNRNETQVNNKAPNTLTEHLIAHLNLKSSKPSATNGLNDERRSVLRSPQMTGMRNLPNIPLRAQGNESRRAMPLARQDPNAAKPMNRVTPIPGAITQNSQNALNAQNALNSQYIRTINPQYLPNTQQLPNPIIVQAANSQNTYVCPICQSFQATLHDFLTHLGQHPNLPEDVQTIVNSLMRDKFPNNAPPPPSQQPNTYQCLVCGNYETESYLNFQNHLVSHTQVTLSTGLNAVMNTDMNTALNTVINTTIQNPAIGFSSTSGGSIAIQAPIESIYLQHIPYQPQSLQPTQSAQLIATTTSAGLVSVRPQLYRCSLCANYQFTTYKELEAHVQAIHGNILNVTDRFVCPLCPNVTVFANEGMLKEHEKTQHTFVCNVCCQVFPNGYELDTHCDLHHNNG